MEFSILEITILNHDLGGYEIIVKADGKEVDLSNIKEIIEIMKEGA